ncbi:MAG: ABC transporter permease [Clostridia bacterium]|nr:ABC transporter permease [Clostridia bacterium]
MRALQVMIYTRKFLRTLKKESIVSIIIGIVITILVMAIIGEDMFEEYGGTVKGFFCIVSVCIWVGIFNSIQLVCREKNDIVKDELDKSLHASSYMAAHFIYQFFLSLVQAIIIFAIFWIFVHDSQYISGNPLSYMFTIFLIIYASDAMGFAISSAVPTPIVAMTVMPLFLIVQLLMAGVLFDAPEALAALTVSKWGMASFGRIGSLWGIIMPSKEGEKITEGVNEVLSGMGMPEQTTELTAIEEHGMFDGSTAVSWGIMVLFIAIFFAISVLALKFTTRKLKK